MEGGGSSKLQMFTLKHTDPALLFSRKSLRCATNNSTKNLGCASAILSIEEQKYVIFWLTHEWQDTNYLEYVE